MPQCKVSVHLRGGSTNTIHDADSVVLKIDPIGRLSEAVLTAAPPHSIAGHGLAELRAVEGKMMVMVEGPADERRGPFEADLITTLYPSTTEPVQESRLPVGVATFSVTVFDGDTVVYNRRVRA